MVVETALDEVDGCTVTFTVVVVPAFEPGQSVLKRFPFSVNPSNDCAFTVRPPHMAWTTEASSSKPLMQGDEH